MLLDKASTSIYCSPCAPIKPDMAPVSAVEESQTSAQPKGELATEPNKGPKIGRKGDPRMHIAVAARLADPELSLFDALVLGGFEYRNDNDPNCVDSEKITLGQRKNQLSRRLRLAKKSDGYKADGIVEPIADESITSNRSITGNPKSKDKNPSKQNKRTSSDYLSGNKRGPETSQVLGVGVQPARRSIKDLEDRISNEQKRQREEPSALAAKDHPDFHHIIIPRGAGGLTFAPPSAANPNAPRVLPQAEVAMQEHLRASRLKGGMTNFPFSNQKTHPSQPSMPPPSISNFAIRSLNETAKSAGITLEELALALSTCKNLTRVLSGISADESTDSDSNRKKHELALRFHECETKTLYSRCMLMSGYGHDEASEGGPHQLRFALEACQREGKRLQELIRNNTEVSCDEAPTLAGEPQCKGPSLANTTKTGQAVEIRSNDSRKLHSHDQSVGQSHVSCSSHAGRHIHRLEGECGHRAVLHHPEGGTPHIDFVVGNKVECFGGVPATSDSVANGQVAWPSQYRCEDLGCPNADRCSKTDLEPEGGEADTPKVFDLNTIDFNGQEWTDDFNDDVLMSFFRLGDKASDQQDASEMSAEKTPATGDSGSASKQDADETALKDDVNV